MQEMGYNGLLPDRNVPNRVFLNLADGAPAGVILKKMDRKRKDLNGEQNVYHAKV